jgi:hypothetical protein
LGYGEILRLLNAFKIKMARKRKDEVGEGGGRPNMRRDLFQLP